MALKAWLEKLDGLDEAVAKLYKPLGDEGEGFVLDVAAENGIELANTESLKNALAMERSSVRQLKKDAKKFEGLGEPDAIRKAIEFFEEYKDTPPDSDEANKKKWDNLRTQLVSEYDEKLNERDGEISSLTSQLESTLKEQNARKALERVVADPSYVDILLPHVLGAAEMVRGEDNNFSVVFKDANGVERLNTKGLPIGWDEHVESLKTNETFSKLFAGSKQTGGGTPPSRQTTPATRTPGSNIVLTREEASDPTRFRAAMSEAEKAGVEVVVDY